MGKIARKKRIVNQIKWGETQRLRTGSRFWDSECSKYRIICSEQYEDIPLPRLYTVWKLLYFPGVEKASLCKIAEVGSRKRAIRTCELRRIQDENHQIEE